MVFCRVRFDITFAIEFTAGRLEPIKMKYSRSRSYTDLKSFDALGKTNNKQKRNLESFSKDHEHP
jgi:hypothetical protein